MLLFLIKSREQKKAHGFFFGVELTALRVES